MMNSRTSASSSSSGYPMRRSFVPALENLPALPAKNKKGAASQGPSVTQVIKMVEEELQKVRQLSWAALENKDDAKAAFHKAEEDGLKERLQELKAEGKEKRELESLFAEAQEQALAVYVPKKERLLQLNNQLIEVRFGDKPNPTEICSLRMKIDLLEEEIKAEKMEEELKKRGLENGSKDLLEQMEREKETIPEIPTEGERARRERAEIAGYKLPDWKPQERTERGTKPRALGVLNKQARDKVDEEKRVVSAKAKMARAKMARRRAQLKARSAQEVAAAREAHNAYMEKKRQAEQQLPALHEELKLLLHGLLDYEGEDDECEEKRELEERRQEVESKIEECEEARRPPAKQSGPSARLPSEGAASTDIGGPDQEAASEEGSDDE